MASLNTFLRLIILQRLISDNNFGKTILVELSIFAKLNCNQNLLSHASESISRFLISCHFRLWIFFHRQWLFDWTEVTSTTLCSYSTQERNTYTCHITCHLYNCYIANNFLLHFAAFLNYVSYYSFLGSANFRTWRIWWGRFWQGQYNWQTRWARLQKKHNVSNKIAWSSRPRRRS